MEISICDEAGDIDVDGDGDVGGDIEVEVEVDGWWRCKEEEGKWCDAGWLAS